MNRITIANALKVLDGLDNNEEPYIEPFKHGSMRIGFYKPQGTDPQEPHTQDELYIIASGNGYFVTSTTRQKCETGEVLFIAAHQEHRFEDFSEDFAAWVVFYGAEGGEKA